MLKFEWDIAKSLANLRKHGVSFEEASVFGDSLAYTFPDPDHSIGEARHLTFGLSSNRRLLTVAHAQRAQAIRIINVRKATKHEQSIYEQGWHYAHEVQTRRSRRRRARKVLPALFQRQQSGFAGRQGCSRIPELRGSQRCAVGSTGFGR